MRPWGRDQGDVDLDASVHQGDVDLDASMHQGDVDLDASVHQGDVDRVASVHQDLRPFDPRPFDPEVTCDCRLAATGELKVDRSPEPLGCQNLHPAVTNRFRSQHTHLIHTTVDSSRLAGYPGDGGRVKIDHGRRGS